MTGGWGIASTGPAVATRVTAAMADEPLTGAFPTGNRVANAANGSSSTTHSIALTASSTVARRDVSSGSTAGATSLTLSRPAATQPGDVLLAHFVVTGGTSTLVTPPPGWALVAGESVDSDAVTKSVVYTHAAAGGDPVGWAWTFNGSREAAGGIAAYSGASAVGSHQHDLNPCGGATPALVGTWTERSNDPAHPGEFLGVFNTVTYNFQAEGVENQLVRRHCTENSGIPVDSQTLARGLAPAASSVAGECDPIACVPRTSPVKVTLTLREAVPPGETVGRVYQLRGTTRANA
jgi:hypothetical protein